MQETIITPQKNIKEYLKELWTSREILYFLVWRDLLVRYKQTMLGILWVVLRPFLVVTIFTLVFSKIVGIDSGGVPYPLVAFSGMLVWIFFSDCISMGSNIFVANTHLISKVYFPRMFLLISKVACSSIDFFVALFCYCVLSFFRYQIQLTFRLIFLPIIFLWLSCASFFITLFLAAITVRHRDFQHIVPIGLQLGLYVTPILYSVNKLPFNWKMLLGLNPLFGIISCLRWVLLLEPICFEACFLSIITLFLLFLLGFWFFLKTESTFVDYL